MALKYYIQVFASLAALGTMLYVFYKFSQSYKNSHFNGGITILDRKPLDKQTNALALKYKTSEFLVLVGAKGTTVVKEFKEEE